MTAALCIKCGKIKQGVFVQCNHCGAQPPNEQGYEVYLSDHYLSLKTLQQFGNAITKINEASDSEKVAGWTLMYLLSEYYPEIVYTSIPEIYKDISKSILKKLNLEPIVIRKNNLAVDRMNSEDKYGTVVKHSEIECPHCGSKKSMAAWRLFNGVTDARLKPLLFQAKIFRNLCLKCHKGQMIHYDMVYFHFEKNPVVIYLDNPKADAEHKINHIPKDYFDELFEDFLYRKVNRPVELIEKIKIFGDGLNDIEVELAKHLLSIEMGMDVTERLQYHEMQSGFFKKKIFTYRDRKNELGMLTYQMKEKKGQAARLLPLMREKLKQQRSEWPVVKAETLIKLLGSEAKYKKHNT